MIESLDLDGEKVANDTLQTRMFPDLRDYCESSVHGRSVAFYHAFFVVGIDADHAIALQYW
jgi:hypothetical protein